MAGVCADTLEHFASSLPVMTYLYFALLALHNRDKADRMVQTADGIAMLLLLLIAPGHMYNRLNNSGRSNIHIEQSMCDRKVESKLQCTRRNGIGRDTFTICAISRRVGLLG